MTTEAFVDARGLRCPLPVLKTEKLILALPPGATFRVLATDPVARIDIPLFCRQNGHQCALAEEGSILTFTITKKV